MSTIFDQQVQAQCIPHRGTAKKRNRRSGYRGVYNGAAPRERTALVAYAVAAVGRNPPPGAAGGRGRPRRHSREKTARIAAPAAAFGPSSREAEGEIAAWNPPRGGGAPYRTTVCRAMATLPMPRLDSPLADTAKTDMAAADFKADAQKASDAGVWIAGADSSGIETDRYGTRERPDKRAGKVEDQRRKTYPKFHTAAPLGLRITLSCRAAGGDAPDTKPLPNLVGLTTKWHGDAFRGMPFRADRGYDSDANFGCVYKAGMRPHIRRRKPQPGTGANRGKPHRRRAAGEFDADRYGSRGLAGGLFGGPESKGHGPLCGYRGEDDREGRGPVTAAGRNPAVPDRLECAGETGIGWNGGPSRHDPRGGPRRPGTLRTRLRTGGGAMARRNGRGAAGDRARGGHPAYVRTAADRTAAKFWAAGRVPDCRVIYATTPDIAEGLIK